MYVSLKSYTLYGLEAIPVNVEVSVSPGLPKFEIIGLPDTSIKESRERIFQSIKRFDYGVPPGNITINLAPAEIKKKGALFDLPIAVGLLLASGQIKNSADLSNTLIAGELSLNGDVKKISGVFNSGYTCTKNCVRRVMLPSENYGEIKYFRELEIIPVRDLMESINFIEKGSVNNNNLSESPPQHNEYKIDTDFSQVYGNEIAKRALQLSIAARLNVLFIGPPGCGKSMLVHRMPTLFGELPEDEKMEVSRIYSAGGILKEQIINKPPFRQTHNTITDQALFGGGAFPTPGEISLAHNGVLFLDEFSEFQKNQIQMLRQPMENKKIVINRMNYTYAFPCNFILVAATNPCSCGYYGDNNRLCRCTPNMISRFYSKLSGPILDRIEMILYIHPPDTKTLFNEKSKSSEEMRNEMSGAMDFLRKNPDYLSEKNIYNSANSDQSVKKLIKDAYSRGFISLRRVKAIIKTALTIALFEGRQFNENHALEAIEYCRYKWQQ